MSTPDPPLELIATGHLPPAALDLLGALLIETERTKSDDEQDKQDERPVTGAATG